MAILTSRMSGIAAALAAVVNHANLHVSPFSGSYQTNGISSFFIN